MGLRGARRASMAVRGQGLPAGVAALLDKDGAPVVSLAPIVQVAAPAPGAPLELFLFDGRGARGARLVALPASFEHHDDELWSWLRGQLTGSLDDEAVIAAEQKPPYRGLSAFAADDGALFFGRERLVDAFVNRLAQQPLLAVVGPSGAGKSSFVQAGVLPALPRGWRAITMRPGPSPVAALCACLEREGLPAIAGPDRDALGRALRDAAAPGSLVFVVDQLEEMFTLCDDPDERRAFAESLANAARAADDPVRVVVTLRDDFLIRAEQLPALRNRIGHGLQLVTVPAREDLIRIVVEPARRLGYELEGDLAAEMIAEVADQPGALALLSFAASKLWEQRDRHFKRLTRAAYRTLGGVGGALAKHADLTIDAMPSEQRALARDAFRHLVTTENTRAILARAELRQLIGGADDVIEKLVAARLLVASDAGNIEIIHEALLVAWPRLADWRHEDLEGARFREQLRSAAKQWQDRGRTKGLLWRGDALADYTRWRAKHADPLTDAEAAFAAASLADAARGRQNRRRLIGGAFATLSTAVAVLVYLYLRGNAQARELHDTLLADYEGQARRLVIAGDPRRGLAYLERAEELGAHGVGHDYLVAEALRDTGGEIFEVKHASAVAGEAFSPDGTRLLSSDVDGVVVVSDAETGRPVSALSPGDQVHGVWFSPDSRTVVTLTPHEATLWNVATADKLGTVVTDRAVRCAGFRADGLAIITGGEQTGISIWDATSRSLVRRIESPSLARCVVSPDGALAATIDRERAIRVWELSTGQRVAELRDDTARPVGLHFSPRGDRLVSFGVDGSAIDWTLAPAVAEHPLAHGANVRDASYSPDERHLVSARTDSKTATVWDLTGSPTEASTLAGHDGAVREATYSPDGRYVVTVSDDATVRLWDADHSYPLARWRGHDGPVVNSVFDRSGNRLATASEDGRVIVWDTRPQTPITWLRGHRDAVNVTQFSASGRELVSAGDDGTVRTWNARTGDPLLVVRTEPEAIRDARISPDDRFIASTTKSGAVELWDREHGRAQPLRNDHGVINELAWSEDGSRLAAATADGMLIEWNATDGTEVFETRAHDGKQVLVVTYADNGIITIGGDQVRRVWDLSGHELPDRATTDPSKPIDLAYDRHGARLAVADGGANLIRVTNGPALTLVGHTGAITGVTWSDDGSLLISTGLDACRVWDASSGELLEIVPQGGVMASISPDRRLAFTLKDGRIGLYPLPGGGHSLADLQRRLRCRSPYVVTDRGESVEERAWSPACRD
jgi:WD40 repeat protein